MYTLDTNAIIYYLKGDSKATLKIDHILKSNPALYISTITETELFSHSYTPSHEIFLIEEMLKTVSIISLDSRIARMAGIIRQVYGLKTADSVIAATAIFTNSALVTRNVKDFKKVKELKVIEI